MLSKKHYEAIAVIFKKYTTVAVIDYERFSIDDEPAFQHGWDSANEIIASDLADYFAEQSERFDRDRFMKACGQDKPKNRLKARLPKNLGPGHRRL